MVQAALRKATYADLEAVPPNLVAEILDGVLVTHPRPLPAHAVAHAALIDELAGPFQKARNGPGGWIFMTEPELHLGEHVIVPDIAGWTRKRMSSIPDEVGITLAPDWVCEVLSRSTASYDRTVKFRIYHQFGVQHLWYVDPTYRTLETFNRGQRRWTLSESFAKSSDVRAAPFDAVEFSLGSLWPFDEPGTGPEGSSPSTITNA